MQNGKMKMTIFEKKTTKTINSFTSNILKYFVRFSSALFEKLFEVLWTGD